MARILVDRVTRCGKCSRCMADDSCNPLCSAIQGTMPLTRYNVEKELPEWCPLDKWPTLEGLGGMDDVEERR
jgi:hypothetical protein